MLPQLLLPSPPPLLPPLLSPTRLPPLPFLPQSSVAKVTDVVADANAVAISAAVTTAAIAAAAAAATTVHCYLRLNFVVICHEYFPILS